MASYEVLIKKITTAEINRAQREGGYSRWAYFVDEFANKAGVVMANDMTFAAFSVADEPDPKLSMFGLEPIRELALVPHPSFLVVAAGENQLRAVLFTSPAVLLEDEFVPGFDPSLAQEWQAFLRARGIKLADDAHHGGLRYMVGGVFLLLIIFFVLLAIAG